VASGAGDAQIIEKIDIGGISLIRAAAKNHADVLIVPSRAQYGPLLDLLNEKGARTSLEDRKNFAGEAFAVSSHYDTMIYDYFAGDQHRAFKFSSMQGKQLRYGENPHQQGFYFGDFAEMFDQLHGKEISYNNLLDIDAAVGLIRDFEDTGFAILKHNNACGLAIRPVLLDAWKDALAGDPISAFGGVLITNTTVDEDTAAEVNKLFFEIIIAPSYSEKALEILKQKKNRIILVIKEFDLQGKQFRSLLNGAIIQDRDTSTEGPDDLKTVTRRAPSAQEVNDLVFANKLVKHTKSNAIVLAKNDQLVASGVGQTSRVDALKQAIEKARGFGFDLKGAVMASDAFFPFPDCVEIADKAGISAVIQPGGSIRDQESIDYCDQHNMAMVVTGKRHFKH
jgi:phosphoribosylaminoimidazolecarboxamide formyltransferase/IMP cyclohydrolase